MYFLLTLKSTCCYNVQAILFENLEKTEGCNKNEENISAK